MVYFEIVFEKKRCVLMKHVKTLNKAKTDKIIQSSAETTVDTSIEHVKELEDELLKLRIENAFLKELRRLRLEDEAKMRERRESSTASEDSSN